MSNNNRIIINVITDYIKQDQNTNQVLILNCVNQVLRCDTLVSRTKNIYDKALGSEIICVEALLKLMTELPNILKEILTFTALTKSLRCNDTKYVVYALFYQYLITSEPNFINEIDEKQLRNIFGHMWFLISLIPNDIRVLKSKLAFLCCGNGNVKNNPY